MTGYANGGEAQWKHFLGKVYHTPDDDLSQKIDWNAAARYGELNYRISRTLADADQRPLWYRGDYFGDRFAPAAAARRRALTLTSTGRSDLGERPDFRPIHITDLTRTGRRPGHEDSQFPEVAQVASSRLPGDPPPWPHLRDQQDQPPLQSAPGLSSGELACALAGCSASAIDRRFAIGWGGLVAFGRSHAG